MKETGLKVLENEVKNLKESNANEHKNISDALIRIETKLDVKADKDEVDRLAETANAKLDGAAIIPIKEKVDLLENRIWYVVAGIIVSLMGAIISYMVRR